MNYTDYVSPELIAGVPVLMTTGKILKGIETVKNQFIPLILGIAGAAYCTAHTIIFNGIEQGQSAAGAVLTGITQGILVAGAAVYGHQIFKQIKEN